jgi:phage portal protein BeeE
MLDEESGEDQVKEIKKQIQAFYSGSQNAGNVIVTNSLKEFKELSLNNKEMEYSKLNEAARNSMYNALEIPASFFDNKASTFNNKLNDRMNLYIFAVMPIADRLTEEYTKALMPRYKNGDMWEITYIPRNITALAPLFDESVLRKGKTGIFTINELRDDYGLGGIGSGGDSLYQPLNLVPLGESVPVGEGKGLTNSMRLRIEGKYNKKQMKRIEDVVHTE